MRALCRIRDIWYGNDREWSIAPVSGAYYLVDQLFNSSEKRLARILLLMAEFGKPGEPDPQDLARETLADMIGTTRSRVSFFMNRFRRLGFLEYNGRIHVNQSLLNVILHDRLSEQNANLHF